MTASHRLPIISFLIRTPFSSPSFSVDGSSGHFLHYNFVCSLLNDVFGIQSRGGCSCAGPFSQLLLGMTPQITAEFEETLLLKQEIIRPGFTRVNFNYFIDEKEFMFIVNAILFIAEHGCSFFPPFLFFSSLLSITFFFFFSPNIPKNEGWKLLSEYSFFTDTGEWRHKSTLTKRIGRKWLGTISYKVLYACM